MKRILFLVLIASAVIAPQALAESPTGIRIDPTGEPPAIDARIPPGITPEGNSPIIVVENPQHGTTVVRGIEPEAETTDLEAEYLNELMELFLYLNAAGMTEDIEEMLFLLFYDIAE